MATIRKTITLTEPQDAWLKAQIKSGVYTNDSEAIRDLIRKAQSENIDAIRAALIAGENSGVSIRTPQSIREDVRKRKAGQGDLAL